MSETQPTTAVRPATRDLALEGLRGFAAAVVIGTHLLTLRLDPGFAASPVLWQFEFAGGAVLIFFVLSGYVIGLTNTGPVSRPAIRDYFRRRIVRLFPINLLAVVLAWWVATSTPLVAVLGNLFFLQHSTGILGWELPLIESNPNLWSLHYEMVYYLLFPLIWSRKPSAPVIATVLVFSLLLRFAIPGAAFLSTYAAGACFWLAGLWLAWRAPVTETERRHPWLAMIILASLTWHASAFERVRQILAPSWTWAPESVLWQLDFLPLALWFVAAAAGRQLPGGRIVPIVAYFLPGLEIAWQLRAAMIWNPDFVYTVLYAVIWLVTLPLLAIRQKRSFWRGFASLGVISYAIYALGGPVQYWVRQQPWIPSGTPESFLIRAMTVVLLTALLAWCAERFWQRACVRLFPRPVRLPKGGATP